jgi:hypothetical protein
MPRHRTRTSLALLLALLCLALPGAPRYAHAQPPAPAAATQVFLPLVTNGQPPAQPTVALIDQAVAAGRLDEQTGLLYKVFAAFDDPRLPAAFRGDNRGAAMPALANASGRLAGLRPDVRAAIAPFLLPPNADGSWLDLREQGAAARASAAAVPPGRWQFVGGRGLNLPFRVWYRVGPDRDDDVELLRALRVLSALRDKIWPQLTPLLGVPKSDEGLHSNGGSGDFDIYLVNNYTKAVPYAGAGCSQNAAFLLMNLDRVDEADLTATFTLATLYKYAIADCNEYDWLLRATAVWATDDVYPTRQNEHELAFDQLGFPELSLEDASLASQSIISDAAVVDYGGYVLPFFLSRKLGQRQLVRAFWDGAANPDSLAAVNAVLPGGFRQAWPDFALANWNRDPVDDYKRIDELTEGAKPAMQQEVRLTDGQVTIGLQDATLEHLSARYYHFTFPDDSARNVTFYNGLGFELAERQFFDGGAYSGQTLMWKGLDAERTRGLHIDALLKIDGSWQMVEDWTERPYVSLCRDVPSTHFSEMVIIVSNADWQDRGRTIEPAAEPPTLLVSDIGCQRYVGQSQQTYTLNNGGSMSWSASGVVFERGAVVADEDDEGYGYLRGTQFIPGAGSVTHKADLNEFFCHTKIEGSGAAFGDPEYDGLFVYNFTLSGRLHRVYTAQGISTAKASRTQNCFGVETHDETEIGLWLDADIIALNQVDPNGQTIAATKTGPLLGDSGTATYSWQFSAR